MRRSLVIRDLVAANEADWRRLWACYNAFYEAEVPEAVTQATWSRVQDPGSGIGGRAAVVERGLVGFAHYILNPSTWTLGPTCYLEDLYVDASARGHGVGGALIGDLIGLGVERRWARIYWHTRDGNATARRLYDRFASADDFVRYRIVL
ncbi:MAG: GNAT family N-acetyltransferase [Gammaproteobacteria bacterium]